MIRFLNVYFPSRTIFLGVSEACLVAFSFLLATIASIGVSDAAVVTLLRDEQGFLNILVVAAAFIICMYYFDLYNSAVLNNPREVLTRLVQTEGTVCVLLACLYYLYPPLGMGRRIFLGGFFLVATLLFVWRFLFFWLNALPRFAERALILGDGPLAVPLLAELKSHPELGIRVVGQLNMLKNGNGGTVDDSSEEQVKALMNLVEVHQPDRIIIAFGERRGKLPVEALLYKEQRRSCPGGQ